MKHLLLILLVLTGCSTTVKTLTKPDYDLSTHKTWCWVEGCEPFYGNGRFVHQELAEEISNAIASNMAKKGYVQTDGNSDLLVNFYLTIEEDSTLSSQPYQFGDERDWVQEIYPEYRQFLKGALVIDILGRSNSELLWTSKAERHFEPQPQVDKKMVWSGVAKTMRKLPAQK